MYKIILLNTLLSDLNKDKEFDNIIS